MNISYCKIEDVRSFDIGNPMRHEGVRYMITENIDEDVASNLANRITMLGNDLVPFRPINDGMPTIVDKMSLALNDQDKRNKLAQDLYESCENDMIPSCSLIIAKITVYDVDHEDGVEGIAMMCYGMPHKYLGVNNSDGRVNYINTYAIGSAINRAVIWLKGDTHLWSTNGRSLPHLYWTQSFLKVKPMPTKDNVTKLILEVIKATQKELKENGLKEEFRSGINDGLVYEDDSISLDDLFYAAFPLVGDDFLPESILMSKMRNLGLGFDARSYMVPVCDIKKSINKWAKTFVTDKVKINVTGVQSVEGFEEIHSDNENEVIVKIKLR